MSHAAANQLSKLKRLAQLKSDLELRKYSAYRAHVEIQRARVDSIANELSAIFEYDMPFSIEAARLANSLASERSRALHRAEAELAQMLVGFEAVRKSAMREFGRVQALDALSVEAKRDRPICSASASDGSGLG